MRILIATCHRAIIGGIESYLRILIPALLKRGHNIAVLYERHSRDGETTVDPAEAALTLWFWEDLQRTPALWQELLAWKPDVVYAHGSASLELENILLNNYPTVLYAHVYLGTCTTGRKSHSFPQMQPCGRRFGPMCLVLHYPRRCGGLNPLEAWRAFQFQSRRNTRLTHYSALLVASTHMYREFEQHGISRDKLQLVPLPIDSTLPTTPLVSKTPEGRLLFVGRLTDLKGVRHLLEAIQIAVEKVGRSLTLTIAGDGPERVRLQEFARRHGVAAEFVGWVNSTQKLDLMRQADLLVVPSLWPEPFGLVGIEAGTLGLPAVGYAVGGIPDWLIPGQTGELAPGDPPTVSGLADAIGRALAEPSHYAELCRGARKLASRFTLNTHVRKLEEILIASTNTVNWTTAGYSRPVSS